MTGTIEIVLCDPRDPDRELSLFYRPGATGIAKRYFEALAECEAAGYRILDPDRFYNLPNSHMDCEWIAQELQAQIDLINECVPATIPHRAEASMGQEKMNLLHGYFERLRGALLAPGAFYLAAPDHVQTAINRFNLLIHRYEDRSRQELSVGAEVWRTAHAVLTFEDARPRFPLQDEDYAHFQRRRVFGDLLVNYCELGKPLLDAIADKDDVVGDDNIRPLRYYSADAMLRFSATTPLKAHLVEEARWFMWWFSPEAAPYKALGFVPHDPRNAMGHITVATLIRDEGAFAGLSDREIVELVGQHPYFARVHCHPEPSSG